MSEKDNGGPAFPVRVDNNDPTPMEVLGVRIKPGQYAQFGGMTMRDHFAGLALQGMLANSGGPIQRNEQSAWALTNCTFDDVSEFAYEFADAMLKARGN